MERGESDRDCRFPAGDGDRACFGDLTRSFTFSLCGDISLCERLTLTGDRLLGEPLLSACDLSLRADGLCLRGGDTRSLAGERDLVCPDLLGEPVLSGRDLSLRAGGLCLRGGDTRSLAGERDLVCPDLRED